LFDVVSLGEAARLPPWGCGGRRNAPRNDDGYEDCCAAHHHQYEEERITMTSSNEEAIRVVRSLFNSVPRSYGNHPGLKPLGRLGTDPRVDEMLAEAAAKGAPALIQFANGSRAAVSPEGEIVESTVRPGSSEEAKLNEMVEKIRRGRASSSHRDALARARLDVRKEH